MCSLPRGTFLVPASGGAYRKSVRCGCEHAHVVLTISTEHGALCETELGTLPSTLRSIPLLPITSTSAPFDAGELDQDLRRVALARLARPAQPALLGALLAVAQRRVDVLGGVDRPLQLVGRVAALALEPRLAHRARRPR